MDSVDVCLAAPLFYPTFTGAGIRFLRYARGLRSRGIKLTVLSGTLRNPVANRGVSRRVPSEGDRTGMLLPLEHVGELPVQRVKLPEGSTYRRQAVYVSSLIEYCRRPGIQFDLLHALSVSQYWSLRTSALRQLGIPILVSYTLLGRLSSNPFKRSLQRFFWPLPYRIADCIIANSDLAVAALHSIGVTRRIEVIPNGLDLDRFRPLTSQRAVADLREHLGLDLAGEYVVFVGSLIERKGVDLLVEAWATIVQERPRAYLVIVGPKEADMLQESSRSGFQAKVDGLIARSGAGKRVIFTGMVENVEAYLQIADVFVFPSAREGLPNAVLEAYGCGAPSILTPFIGLSGELGEPDEHYILADRSPNALAAATIALLESPARREQLSRRCRQWVEQTMNVENSLDQYAALYREYAERHPRRFRT